MQTRGRPHQGVEFPLRESFFPQLALNQEELRFYKRLGKDRIAQLVRAIEDADLAYKWGESARISGVRCQRAQFLDVRPGARSPQASTLLKASVELPDVRVDEVLQAVAKVKTKDVRKTQKYLLQDTFADGRTLFAFPSSVAQMRPAYSYRAIKWLALRPPAPSSHKAVDFCYLEYAGKRDAPPGSSVVGFCVQESITRDKEVPPLDNYGIVRGYFSRTGIIISRTHQPNTLKVTVIAQIDGDLPNSLRQVLDKVLQQQIARTCARLPFLVDRQRVSSLRFLEEWQWIPNAERKACAVCLRGFYFRRKHHCRACGEVCCSTCAPLRELEEPIFGIAHLRICSECMIHATSAPDSQAPSQQLETSTSNGDTESYIRGLRSPRHDSYEEMLFRMRESHDRKKASSRKRDEDNVLAKTERQLATYNDQKTVAAKENQLVLAPPRSRDERENKDQVEALTEIVNHIREIRDTINMALAEAEYAEDEVSASQLRDQLTRIRSTLESSVANFDAALANTTGTLTPPERMTADQFQNVARITFAAARATEQAGQAFLSSVASEDAEEERLDESYDSIGSTDSDEQFNPYSSHNYAMAMATAASPPEDKRLLRATSTHSVRMEEVQDLERKIHELQSSLLSAQHKLSAYNLSDEPEADSDLDAVYEQSAQAEIESVFNVFGQRGQTDIDRAAAAAAAQASASKPAKGHLYRQEVPKLTTEALVSELRGVMSSSEDRNIGQEKERVGRRDSVDMKWTREDDDPGLPRGMSAISFATGDSGSDYGNYHVMAGNRFVLDDEYDSSDVDDEDLAVMDMDDQQSLFLQYEGDHTRDKEAISREQESDDSSATNHDNSTELRELIRSLERPRSSSLPQEVKYTAFMMPGQLGSMDDLYSQSPAWSDGVPAHHQSSAHRVEELMGKVRACLAALKAECPSAWERRRKLESIFKVLRSLHHEGVRSKFRTLYHEDIRYARMKRETPSLVRLLSLAGFVALTDRITMRVVEPEALAVCLRELEPELRD